MKIKEIETKDVGHERLPIITMIDVNWEENLMHLWSPKRVGENDSKLLLQPILTF